MVSHLQAPTFSLSVCANLQNSFVARQSNSKYLEANSQDY